MASSTPSLRQIEDPDAPSPQEFRAIKAQNLQRLIDAARKYDSAAQGADREFYSEFRARAFAKRRVARGFEVVSDAE